MTPALAKIFAHEAAIGEARAGIKLERTHHPFHWVLGWAMAGLGRNDEAIEALRHATVLAPDEPISLSSLGWALGLAGCRQEAITILSGLEEKRRTHEYVPCVYMALTSVGLGDTERAMAWLHEAEEERDPELAFLNAWPFFDPLRSDPRFQALLRRMHFLETASSG